MPGRLAFPNPVNETSARIVAAGVVVLGSAYLASGSIILLFALVYGFAARTAAGPRYSPLALLATRVIVPRMNMVHKFVPGPPKRFAQTIGLFVSSTALVFDSLGRPFAAMVAAAVLVVAATLESVFALCLGCIMFGFLVRLGVVPRSVCEACNDFTHNRPDAGSRG